MIRALRWLTVAGLFALGAASQASAQRPLRDRMAPRTWSAPEMARLRALDRLHDRMAQVRARQYSFQRRALERALAARHRALLRIRDGQLRLRRPLLGRRYLRTI
ncbi:MAG: hypothetical protein ACT4PM_15380 [Gemmatimonadales bacterium]